MAYPYTVVKEGNQNLIKPIDKNGEVIARPDQKHYSAAQWVFEGNLEKTIYACADAVPGQVALSSNIQDRRPVVISGTISNSPQTDLRSSQEKTNAINLEDAQPQLNSPEIDESKKDVHPNTPRMRR